MTTGSMNIGIPKNELDTPALWVDLDKMESNIRRLAAYFAEAGKQWRPPHERHQSTGHCP